MSTDVAVKQEAELIDDSKIVDFMKASGIGANLQDNEKRQFIEVAKAYQLNPFKREIYCVAYGKGDKRKLSLITGYEVYLKRAERTGALNGWNVDIQGSRSNGDLRAIVTIHRKDWEHPFVHEAYWAEYKQDNNMWNSKPLTMIKKVAIAQAFRMCFPDEFGGMPYTSDELPDEMTTPRDVSPEEKADAKPEDKAAPRQNPDEPMLKDLTKILDDAIVDGLITKDDRDSVIANAKKAHGRALEKYIEKIRAHLEELRKKAEPTEEELAAEAEKGTDVEDAEIIEDPEQLDIF